MKRIVLLGPPGAGKGSLAVLLKNRLKLSHISTGDLLREEMKNSTALGKQAEKFIDNGELVPDDLVTKLVAKRLTDRDVVDNGYLLDGFPRNRSQAEDLDSLLKEVSLPLDYVFYMEAQLPLLIKRLTGRRVCRNCGSVYHIINHPPKKEGGCYTCGKKELYQRPDDNEETIKNRMDVYLKNTMPIVDY